MTFESHVRAVLAPNTPRAASLPAYSGPDILAALSYTEELRMKRLAWGRFAKELRAGNARIDDIVASEQPRNYRATSRRHVLLHRGHATLAHGEGSVLDAAQAALLEPPVHSQIYEIVQRLVFPAKPPFNVVNIHLRGSYDEIVIIYEVREIDAEVVRTLRKWTKTISAKVPELKHAWIYHDPSDSTFFVEQERPPRGFVAKKLEGSAAWIQKVGTIDYQVGVFSFTQVNLAAIPSLLDVVRNVRGAAGGTLYDVFSGYGLFGAAFAKEYERIVAIDADEATVANARYNIKRAGGNVTAIPAMLTIKTVERLYESEMKSVGRPPASDQPPVIPRRTMIVDTPRGGMAPNVRASLAELEPQRIVELFNEPDEINRALREWSSAGYIADVITPIDLYPGTANIEVVVGLGKKGEGAKPPVRTSAAKSDQPATRSRAHVKTSR